MIGHRHRFGKALGLIVHAPDANGIDLTPVAFGLGMHLGVSIDFGGGGEQIFRLLRLRQTECVVGAERSHLQNLNGEALKVSRAGR